MNTKKQSHIRLIALVLCVFFVLVTLLSSAFILSHADHTHDHNGPDGSCATCAHLAAAENLLKTLSTALAGAALVYGGLSTTLSTLKPSGFQAGFNTLVRLKIRLNN